MTFDSGQQVMQNAGQRCAFIVKCLVRHMGRLTSRRIQHDASDQSSELIMHAE